MTQELDTSFTTIFPSVRFRAYRDCGRRSLSNDDGNDYILGFEGIYDYESYTSSHRGNKYLIGIDFWEIGSVHRNFSFLNSISIIAHEDFFEWSGGQQVGGSENSDVVETFSPLVELSTRMKTDTLFQTPPVSLRE